MTLAITRKMNDTYLGNINIKRDGVVHNFVKNEVLEYSKCLNNPGYFAKNYCKIIHLDKGLVPFELYPYQEKMFDKFNTNRFNIVLACRQSGKSISSVPIYYGLQYFILRKLLPFWQTKVQQQGDAWKSIL